MTLLGPKAEGVSAAILDHFILFFGAWSIAVHMAMLAQWPLVAAVALYAGIHAGVLALWVRFKDGGLDHLGTDEARPPAPARPLAMLTAVGLMAWIAVAGIDAAPLVNWILVLMLVALGIWATIATVKPAPALPVPDARRFDGIALAWAAAAAALLLFLTRPNADDSYYTAMANRVFSNPWEPLLLMDPVHGMGPGAMMTDAYRAHAFEVLAGALGIVTGLEPIVWLQVVAPPLSAALIILSAARLARLAVPAQAALVVALVFVLSVVFHNSYGFLRLQQGKHLLFMMMPMFVPFLVCRYAIVGGPRAWVALLFAVAAGTGLSSSGLYLMPLLICASIVAAFFVLAGRVPWRSLLGRLVAAGVPMGYAFGLTVLLFVTETKFGWPEREHTLRWIWRPDLLSELTEDWERNPVRLAQVFGLTTLPAALAWALTSSRAMLALGAGFGLAFVVAIYNPAAMGIYEDTPGLGVIYKRIQFLYPIIFFVAVMLAAPVAAFSWRQGSRDRWVIALGGLGMLGLLMYQGPLMYSGLGLDYSAPSLPLQFKRPLEISTPEENAVVHCLVEAIGPDRLTLAPHAVGIHIPQVPGHPPLVLNRANNVSHIARVVGPEEAALRLAMITWAGDDARRREALPYDAAQFEAALRDLGIKAVVVGTGGPAAQAIEPALREAAFTQERACDRYQVWLAR